MSAALAALDLWPQWITYRLQASSRPGKTDKIPVCGLTGHDCNAHDPANWTDAATARAAATARGLGVGFVLTPADPFFCLDIDGALMPDRTWSPFALDMCKRLAGAAVEVSQSGTGLHIWGTHTGSAPAHGCRNAANGAELYHDARFIALGHPGATGNAATDCTAALTAVIAEYFPPVLPGAASAPAEWTDNGADPANDDALIARMLASKSTGALFGGKASFSDLWTANPEALGRAFPDATGGRPYDASRADAALAQHLAFWTGKGCEQMRRIMQRSSLARAKWEKHGDYLERTILAAVANQTTVMQPRAASDPVNGWNITPFADDAPPDLSHDQLALDLGAAGWSLDARYVPAWGWLFWDGVHWAKDDRLHAFTALRDYLRGKASMLVQWAGRMALTVHPDDGEKLINAARKKATELRDGACRSAVELTARSNRDLVATVEQFDADADILGTPSGSIDLRTGEARAPSRADYITRSVAVDPAPLGAPCSLWSNFLHRAFAGDVELIGFVQRAAGYALTGYTREQKLLFLYGNGANGKSVFLNTLQWLLSEYAKRAPADTFLDSKGERHPTDLAGLRGARLVVSSELPPGKSWNEAVVKDLTGGDVITARFMRGDFFEYTPQFTLLVAGNHRPTFRGIDEAIRRRVLLVPFAVTIPASERDQQLQDKLKTEGPAILRWCIDGAVAWYRDGLRAPESVEAASADYLDGEDLLGEFLSDCTTRAPGAGERITSVYFRFGIWASTRGLHSPWSQHALTRALGERGLTVKRREDGRWLMDHQLKGFAQ